MSAVTDILLAPDVRPFAISAAIMVTLGGIELLTMIVGFSISELIGKDFALETESHSAIGGLFLWINAGRLPLLILLILALGVFAITGFSQRLPPQPSACRRSASPAAVSPASSRAMRPMR